MRRAYSTWRYWTFLVVLAVSVPVGVHVGGLGRSVMGGIVGLAYVTIIGLMPVKERP